ncbi:MAG: chlorosome envelope protein B [Chlorobiaceae bacterium]|nr:chlorosome envelope protein B [Chlorobiales bacterium]NTU90904.1 chlorosome envelope protein B [Chlorobiaceae bacterium]NTV24910.1 chlorosome envelope protein B [Chlorobiaceae bacterium]
MSNGTNIDVAGAINTLTETFGKLFQLQIDIANNSLKALANVAEPLAKTATDLIGNVANAATQVLQSVSTAIAPKK